MSVLESLEEMIANLDLERIERAKAAGQQKYPTSIIKQGAELYSVDAHSYDDGSSEVCINTSRGFETGFVSGFIGFDMSGNSTRAYEKGLHGEQGAAALAQANKFDINEWR